MLFGNKLYNLKIICGLHRSGTTYIGNIVDHDPNSLVIHEALNRDFGVVGIPIWYPYLGTESLDSSPEIETLICDILKFRRAWGKKVTGRRKWWTVHAAAKMIWGGRHGMLWTQLKLRYFLGLLPRNIIWKDPFVTFLVGYLIKYHKAKVACVVRHPGAVYYSVTKQAWLFDICNLLAQPSLIRRHADDIPEEYWHSARTDNAVSIALLWKIMARVISFYQEGCPSLFVVRHEDLCAEPQNVARQICEHFEIKFTERIMRYVDQTTQGPDAEPADKAVNSFNRNSKALVNVWREKIDHDAEARLRDAIGDDLLRYYKQW